MPLALTGGYSAVQFCYPAELSLTFRKIAHFCIGNLICAQYRFMDGHQLILICLWIGLNRTRSKLTNLLGHLSGNFGKPYSHGRGEVKHPYPARFNTQLFQNSLNIFHFFSCFNISLQEMAFSFQSPGHINSVGPILYGPQ